MRKPRGVVFLLAGIVIGLFELAEIVFAIRGGPYRNWTVTALQLGIVLVVGIAAVACLRCAFDDMRPARERESVES